MKVAGADAGGSPAAGDFGQQLIAVLLQALTLIGRLRFQQLCRSAREYRENL